MPDTKPLTGFPSVDKPWLKYYSEEAINAPLSEKWHLKKPAFIWVSEFHNRHK